jgi:UDP-N-acetylglucosamine 4,6-dehydratase
MKYLIFGGTGSLGKVLIKRLLRDNNQIVVFSRDEAKQVNVKKLYPDVHAVIGDVRDYDSVYDTTRWCKPNIIINCSALKNVPEVEQFPLEAVKTNILGTENICKASSRLGIHKVLSISTDKACHPINSYGMTKALQERIHLTYNSPNQVYNVARYGNVLSSRGSVIPFFKERLQDGKTLTITDPKMTRFFMTLESSVDLIERALGHERGGKTFIPKIKSARIIDLAHVMCDIYSKDPYATIENIGIRPGEKLDEVLISGEEVYRTEDFGDVFIMNDVFHRTPFNHLSAEYSSRDCLMTYDELKSFLLSSGVLT